MPTVLVGGLAYPAELALDESRVYWSSDDRGGVVGMVPKAGGAPTTISSGAVNFPLGIAVADAVYWVDAGQGRLLSSAKGASSARTVAPLDTNSVALAVHSGYAFISVYAHAPAIDGEIRRIALSDGKTQSIVHGLQTPSSVAVDDANVYWSDLDAGTLMRASFDGQHITELASKPSIDCVAVDDTFVFWCYSTVDTGYVVRSKKDGTEMVTLASGTALPSGHLVLDDSSVYWTSVGSAGHILDGHAQVLQIAKSGGDATVLANNLSSAEGIAVDNDALYWAEALGGRIMRLDKR